MDISDITTEEKDMTITIKHRRGIEMIRTDFHITKMIKRVLWSKTKVSKGGKNRMMDKITKVGTRNKG